MRRLLVPVLAIALALAVTTSAQNLSQERLTRIDRYFQEQVEQEHIAGAVALVLQDGKPVYEHAFGWADKEANRKMSMDTIFRIASMTMQFTGGSALMQMEAGRFTLVEPIGR